LLTQDDRWLSTSTQAAVDRLDRLIGAHATARPPPSRQASPRATCPSSRSELGNSGWCWGHASAAVSGTGSMPASISRPSASPAP